MINAQPSLYELIGGENGLRKLVERFYDLIDSSPEAAQIRALHPKSLKQPREKFFMFLSGWSGGPPLYVEKHGHPRLRMRHMPFSIGIIERDQWIWCMNKALEEMQMDPAVVDHLKARFAEAADFCGIEEKGELFKMLHRFTPAQRMQWRGLHKFAHSIGIYPRVLP